MRKNIITIFIFFIAAHAFSWEFFNFPKEYSLYYDEMANKNILPHNADILEKKHNINLRIFKYKGNVKNEINGLAKIYFSKILEKQNTEQLFIFIVEHKKKGMILISDDLKEKIDEKYIKILQDDLLNSFFGKWYVSEAHILGKVLGGIIYLLDSEQINSKKLRNKNPDVIVVDDFFYLLSRKPIFADLINLFNFEPISFLFYFPFVIHFLFVRVVGMKFQKTGFIISNIVWVIFVLFVFYLIFHRINIFFPEYVKLFYMFVGLNIPLFFYLINLYGNEIESVTYSYLSNVTGGFDTKNLFEGKRWER